MPAWKPINVYAVKILSDGWAYDAKEAVPFDTASCPPIEEFRVF
jgi:hypothetical protein